ncbi:MAG: hypothetical protein Q8Q54_18180 [Methylococcales bacterium]|nr:hypothetical protein [Methylococcales bacterium]MDP3840847.1 hypothetical protein [Methylococcales bacterium]
MNKQTLNCTMAIVTTLTISATATSLAAPPPAPSFSWQTVVNNGDYIPTANCNPTTSTSAPCRKFNSYNQPSVNEKNMVVFRARSKGGSGGEPVHDVYTRDMKKGGAIVKILDRDSLVPEPNNLNSLFVEPPSFPRIDMNSSMIATRGNHRPVFEYTLPDGTDTKAGTTGIYTNPFGSLITGVGKLGAVPEFSFFQVPEFPSITFEVFPGAPAVTQGSTIVFKGNYTVGLASKTGVYYRILKKQAVGGSTQPVVLIANNTHTLIPNTSKLFGSTAPPSAVGNQAVFAGFDNEDNPTAGGIYIAPLESYRLNKQPKLKTLVSIGSQVPDESKNTKFNKLGEGVSFDGRYIAFWGAWGSENKKVRLYCREDGNKDLKAYCESTASGSIQDTQGWYQEKQVPKNQGIFVHDLKNGKNVRIARTSKNFSDFSDFVYWNFSGKAPDVGEGGESDDDGELARWRSTSFVAVSGKVDDHEDENVSYHTAFKARIGITDGSNVYANPVDGIYLRKGSEKSPLLTLVKTGTNGTLFDSEAIDPDTNMVLPVTEMGLERDGFRGNSLAINVSMGTEEAGWAGIYLTRVVAPSK